VFKAKRLGNHIEFAGPTCIVCGISGWNSLYWGIGLLLKKSDISAFSIQSSTSNKQPEAMMSQAVFKIKIAR